MKILVATHHYSNYEGSETYVFTLVRELKNKGHEVFVYSPILGKIAEKTRRLGVKVADDLSYFKGEKFDIIHAQHNIIVIKTRAMFPAVPIVMNIHGVLSELEEPPFFDCRVVRYVAVSEEVRENLIRLGIDKKKIEIVRNFVNTQRFVSKKPINEKLKNILVISNRITDSKRQVIVEAINNLGVDIKFIGLKDKPVWEVEEYINEADLVISLGRGALEAMACGRAVLIYDYLGSDGLLNENNYQEIRKNNFSGRRYRFVYNSIDLINELNKYSSSDSEKNRAIILKSHNSSINVDALIEIYRKAVEAEKINSKSFFSLFPRKCSSFFLVFIQYLINKFNKKIRRSKYGELNKKN